MSDIYLFNQIDEAITKIEKEIFILSKYCKNCNRVRPINHFSLDLRNKDGYQQYCKQCKKNYAKDFAVYSIVNTVTGKVYFGSSAHPEYRFTQHKSKLKGGYHPNKYLQADWNKYGEKVFTFQIVERVEENLQTLREAEQRYIKNTEDIYNMHKKVALTI
jgi:predicted GIY-YIG superfamily endonuclease